MGDKSSEAMVAEQRVSTKVLRQKLPSVYRMYKLLREDEKIHLPKWKCKGKRPKWVSEKYLTGVLTRLYFSLKQPEVRNPVEPVKSTSKAEIIRYLQGSVDRD